MGLFSKILGGAASELDLNKLVKTVSDAAGKAADEIRNAAGQAVPRNDAPAVQPRRSAPSSGFSWGEEMPAEENQYSFNGSYIEYFDRIFREEFPDCSVSREPAGARSTVFTLRRGAVRALVVELMSERSEAKKLRRDCAAQGVPYVRFYYDHPGWWNTRSYVVEHIRAALR